MLLCKKKKKKNRSAVDLLLLDFIQCARLTSYIFFLTNFFFKWLGFSRETVRYTSSLVLLYDLNTGLLMNTVHGIDSMLYTFINFLSCSLEVVLLTNTLFSAMMFSSGMSQFSSKIISISNGDSFPIAKTSAALYERFFLALAAVRRLLDPLPIQYFKHRPPIDFMPFLYFQDVHCLITNLTFRAGS